MVALAIFFDLFEFSHILRHAFEKRAPSPVSVTLRTTGAKDGRNFRGKAS